jgi:hypothetical protein
LDGTSSHAQGLFLGRRREVNQRNGHVFELESQNCWERDLRGIAEWSWALRRCARCGAAAATKTFFGGLRR